MAMSVVKTFKQLLVESTDINEIIEYLSLLDEQLKNIHSLGYYIDEINFDTIVINGYQDLGFYKMIPIGYGEDSQKKYTNNIKQLAETALGAYVYLSSKELGEVQDISYFDYSKIVSLYDPNFITNNYSIIRDSIIYEPEYYDKIVDGQFEYFSEYLKTKKGTNGKPDGGTRLSYTTVAGKDYHNGESAFVKGSFILIFTSCLLISSFIAYILYCYI